MGEAPEQELKKETHADCGEQVLSLVVTVDGQKHPSPHTQYNKRVILSFWPCKGDTRWCAQGSVHVRSSVSRATAVVKSNPKAFLSKALS